MFVDLTLGRFGVRISDEITGTVAETIFGRQNTSCRMRTHFNTGHDRLLQKPSYTREPK